MVVHPGSHERRGHGAVLRSQGGWLQWEVGMNKKELVAKLAERTGLSQVRSMEVINALFDPDAGIIPNELNEGSKVSVPGFGTFFVKARAARTGTNPSNQQPLNIPERLFPKFRPGKNLKERIQG